MDAFENRVRAYNECAEYLNDKVPKIQAVLRWYEGREISGALLTSIINRCKPTTSKLFTQFDVSAHSIKVLVKKEYPITDNICNYIFFDMYICFIRGKHDINIPPFIPFPIVKMAEVRAYMKEYFELKELIEGKIEAFDGKWAERIPSKLGLPELNLD